MKVETIVKPNGTRFISLKDMIGYLYRERDAFDERHGAAEIGYIRGLIKRLEGLEK